MLILDPAFDAALTKTPSTLCWCWLITRRDGRQYGFTNLDVPIKIGSVTYYGITGFDPSAAQSSQGLDKLDSQTLKGFLDVSAISKADLDSGIFDRATVRRFICDYTNLPTSLEQSPPKFRELTTSYFATKKSNNLGYEIQCKDQLSLLDHKIGNITSMRCRWSVGDGNCGVDTTGFTHDLSVASVLNNRVFSLNTTFADQYFSYGWIKFTSGSNAGLDLDVSLYEDNQIILAMPAPFKIAAGDTLTAIRGCDGSKLSCITIFGNYDRFGGEPDIPSTDLSINTPKSPDTPAETARQALFSLFGSQ